MLDFLAPLFIGFLGSFHCLGMCGPLVLAYSLQETSKTTGLSLLTRSGYNHLLFQGGRTISYVLLGCVAWTVGHSVDLKLFVGNIRTWGTLVGGTLMIILGLMLLGFLPSFSFGSLSTTCSRRSPRYWVKKWMNSPKPWSKLSLGIATGFLPCMLPWAMMVKAAVSSSLSEAFLTMFLFGVGTAPSLLFLGICATTVSVRIRLAGEKMAGLGIIAMGALLDYKALKHLVNLHGG